MEFSSNHASAAVFSRIRWGRGSGEVQGHCHVFFWRFALLAYFLGLQLSSHGDLIVEEIAAPLCCYLYGTYPPIVHLAYQRLICVTTIFMTIAYNSPVSPGLLQSSHPSIVFNPGPNFFQFRFIEQKLSLEYQPHTTTRFNMLYDISLWRYLAGTLYPDDASLTLRYITTGVSHQSYISKPICHVLFNIISLWQYITRTV